MIQKIKRPLSILLSIMMVVSLFTIVPITASAVTENDINDLCSQMYILAEEREQQDDYIAADALMTSSKVLYQQFAESEFNANDPNVERAYNIALAFYNHFNGTGSVDVTSVSATEVDKLARELKALSEDYITSDDYYNFMLLQSAVRTLSEAFDTASGNEDPNLLSAYSLASFILAQYTGTTGFYTVTWKNGDTTLETDADVESGAAPSYGGATPTKASDSDKHYTFSGWSDGTNTYGLSDTLPNVTADVTYTAQFTEAAHTFANPTFNWTQDASTGDWNCDKLTFSCTGCDATQDYEVAGFFGASAVTCTANTDGSFTDVYYNEDMEKPEYKGIWDAIHAKLADYGFILRYLEGEEHITGYRYEPWHIRYVDDPEIAREIMSEPGMTLEEYLAGESAPEVTIDLSGSSLYTDEELWDAMLAVKCKFAAWAGCELHAIRYAGDDSASEESLAWLNSLEQGEFTQVMELLVDFHTGEEADSTFETNHDYTDYQWWLGRTEDGSFEIVSWGY